MWRHLEGHYQGKVSTGLVVKSSYLAQVHQGVNLSCYPSSSSEPFEVQLGITTAQDLTVELGPPTTTHYREDDRMTIHSRLKLPDDEEEDSSCKFFP